jgi:hypothetical protein
MGGSIYSSSVFTNSVAAASTSPGGFYSYSSSAKKIHELLDPAKPNKSGVIIRESRDSANHPTSNAVAILFDVTGSMQNVPRQFVDKLNSLMSILVKKNYLPDPQLLFGAIGDAGGDSFPLQVGQFESGEEQVDVLTKVILEGGGGGTMGSHESYELAMYFLSRYAAMDCVEKRGKKGYLFLLGDENPYPKVQKAQVERLIGEKIEDDIPLETVLEKLREKFEVFWIMPGGTYHYNDSYVLDNLQQLFGQNFLKLPDPADVSELIVSTIGLCEGYDVKSIEADLISAGSSNASAKNATTALATFVNNSSLVRKSAKIDGALATPAKKTGAKRL